MAQTTEPSVENLLVGLRAIADKTLQKLGDGQTQLGDRMDQLEIQLGGRMDQLETQLGDRMDQLETQLGGKMDQLEETMSRKYVLTPLLKYELNNMNWNSEHNTLARLFNSNIHISTGRLQHILDKHGKKLPDFPDTKGGMENLHCNYPNSYTCASLR